MHARDPMENSARLRGHRHAAERPTAIPLDRSRQDVLVLLGGFAVLALWEWSSLDLPLIRLYATAAGFEWRDCWRRPKFDPLTAIVPNQI